MYTYAKYPSSELKFGAGIHVLTLYSTHYEFCRIHLFGSENCSVQKLHLTLQHLQDN